METRIAIIGIIIEDPDASEQINRLLHEYGDYIVGRMGIPYRQRNVNIICIVLDAPNDVINTLAGKIGKVRNVSAKTIYSKA
jgi:iron complex transport system ATP-binding protein